LGGSRAGGVPARSSRRDSSSATHVRTGSKTAVRRPHPPPGSRERPSDGVRRVKKRRRIAPPPKPRLLATVLALVCLVLSADAIFVAAKLGTSLSRARAQLAMGSTSLGSGDLRLAGKEFTEAARAASEAQGVAWHPSFALASALPLMGPDAEAAVRLSQAAHKIARGGLGVVRDIQARATGRNGLVGSFYRDGTVNFQAVEEAKPALARVEGLLGEADSLLTRAPRPTLAFLQDALAATEADVNRANQTARRVRLLFNALPNLLGKDSTRRYLLAFQSPSEARGSGGFMGLYGVLRATNGRLTLGHIGPIQELRLAPSEAVNGPKWFERRYEGFAGLWQWQQANLSAHFPTVAQVWLRMYQTATGRRLDGVMAMDPIALEQLLIATGPVSAPGWNVQVDGDNASKILLHDSYLRFTDPDAQDEYLGGLVEEFWNRLAQGAVDPPTLALGLATAVRTQHLKLYSRHRQDQHALSEVGADGAFASQSTNNPQLIFNDNVSANKVDYFLQRTINTTVSLTQREEARVLTTVTLENRAPDGPSSLLLGPYVKGDSPGINRMVLNLLLPHQAEVDGYAVDGRRRPVLLAREAGFPVVWDILEIPPGETMQVSVSYTLPEAINLSDGKGRFAMTLFPQARATPDEFSLAIAPPYEHRVLPSYGQSVGSDGSVTVSGTLSEPVSVTVELRPIAGS
jgi:hypothetical protein